MSLYGNQGVVVPAGQGRAQEKGPPNTIIAIAPVEQYAVWYYDDFGRPTRAIWYLVNGTWYSARGSEEFAAQLGQVKDRLAKQATDKQRLLSAPSSARNGVDVVDAASKDTAAALGSGVDV